MNLARKRISSVSLAVGVAILVALGVFVWPTLYRYDHMKLEGSVYVVRIHRLTGRAQILHGFRGWRDAKASEDKGSKTVSMALPADQLAKLTGHLAITSYGFIRADIYNGTERALSDVRVRLVIRSASGEKRLDREYNLISTGSLPLSASEFIAECDCRLEVGEKHEWHITAANWSAVNW
jgi:hypothetical protein